MVTSEKKTGVIEALSKVAAEVGAIAKTKRNQQQGYDFRGIDQVYNAVNGPMTKHGVVCTTQVSDVQREERKTSRGGTMTCTTLTLAVTFWGADGSSVTTTTIGEGMDSGDKSANKAMSAALKYAMFQTLLIPTEQMVDSEHDSPEVEPRDNPPTGRQPAPPAPAAPNGQAAGNGAPKSQGEIEQERLQKQTAFIQSLQRRLETCRGFPAGGFPSAKWEAFVAAVTGREFNCHRMADWGKADATAVAEAVAAEEKMEAARQEKLAAEERAAASA